MGNIFKFLYPPRCPACRQVMEEDGTYIHPECRGAFKTIGEPRCYKCGRRLWDPESDICSGCRQKKHSYGYGLALYEYNEVAQRAMLDYKSEGIRRNGDFFASEAVNVLGRLIKRLDPEVLVPVPITDRKMRIRGFNQSEYLAEKIGGALNIPVDTDILFRTGEKAEQKKLSGRERLKIVSVSFTAVDDNPYKRICLVDDVYTTGSTMEGCTRALMSKGAKDVGFVVIFSVPENDTE